MILYTFNEHYYPAGDHFTQAKIPFAMHNGPAREGEHPKWQDTAV